jgi:hypothetical protein
MAICFIQGQKYFKEKHFLEVNFGEAGYRWCALITFSNNSYLEFRRKKGLQNGTIALTITGH